ncbi:iron complex transport system ATP-binding protein [Alicyclobacillus macrosporangiidus]|jgi:iron complex transport system ATP-binding protein|uniref:Iron complex transport system ATP-binding protein n=2 Tax=Alicyclobacillus macrosporangiidus TaxID=392015 RepID=A0A1I7JHJ7_9BACL|nr:iron complex transport system ATP-binding protein [Alicyclobacillus macrosporangiidus]
MLLAENIQVGYGSKIVIQELNLTIAPGQITTFIGANGCGKSTLLRTLARLLKPTAGTVLLDGRDIFKRSTREVAKQLALLPQTPYAPPEVTVRQLVRLGRYPHGRWLGGWSDRDEQAVQEALAAMKLTDLADQPVDTLSGGQRQRAWIAMTLAQETDLLLLDEPTTYLDLSHQLDILDILRELNRRHHKTIVMVLHDLNLAARYSDVMVAVHQGTVYTQGKPEKVMTPETIRAIFDVECVVIPDPVAGTPLCIPIATRNHEVGEDAGRTQEPAQARHALELAR